MAHVLLVARGFASRWETGLGVGGLLLGVLVRESLRIRIARFVENGLLTPENNRRRSRRAGSRWVAVSKSWNSPGTGRADARESAGQATQNRHLRAFGTIPSIHGSA